MILQNVTRSSRHWIKPAQRSFAIDLSAHTKAGERINMQVSDSKMNDPSY